MTTRLFLCLVALTMGLTTLASDPLVTRAQNHLYKLGYPPGPIDGVMGPRTRSALEYFQGDHDIAQSGRLDATTLALLKLSQDRYEAPTPVVRLQAYLKDRNYYSGTVDGLIGRRTWRAIQAYLKDQRHYQGKVDGIAGPITRTAVSTWQASLGVEQTSVLDMTTIRALVGMPISQN